VDELGFSLHGLTELGCIVLIKRKTVLPKTSEVFAVDGRRINEVDDPLLASGESNRHGIRTGACHRRPVGYVPQMEPIETVYLGCVIGAVAEVGVRNGHGVSLHNQRTAGAILVDLKMQLFYDAVAGGG